MQAYRALEEHPDVGGEALMRLGAMQMPRGSGPRLVMRGDAVSRKASPDEALTNLSRAEALTRDPYVVFLAHYFTGRIFEQERKSGDAERKPRN